MIVSVNYGKKLDYILTNSRESFDHCLIATSIEDVQTQSFAQKHKCETVFFDFKTNAKFNKGGAIKKMQAIAYDRFPGYAHLILDADSLLPNDWKCDIDPDVLYGCTRKLYSSLKNLKEDEGRIDPYSLHSIIGFFQLYLPTRFYYYQDGESAAKVDEMFTSLFYRKEKLPFSVKSLGDISHWEGTIEEDFIW